MVAITTYARLTNDQKQALREQHIAHPTMKHRKLGGWAVTVFKLSHAPSRMTVHRVLAAEKDYEANPDQKRRQPVQCPRLEAQLIRWKRHKLTSKRVHGEAASTKSISVEEGRAALQAITQGYAKRDIYNMDETAYFYYTPPHKTVSTKRMSGRKKPKQRLTVAVTCNADGSAKLPLLFVGSARRPRCFDGKTGEQLGFEYASTAKGWMNMELFQSWVRRFDDGMRAENCHVLLLLDNASSHRLSKPLSHVTLEMLPPNTTAYLQLQDAGIIQAFKTQIERLKTSYVVDKFGELLNRAADVGKEHIERETGVLFQVDVLVAMQWAKDAWEMITSTTSSNCWRHTRILDDDIYELVDSVERLRLETHSLRQLLN